MSVPFFQEIMLPLLQGVADGPEHELVRSDKREFVPKKIDLDYFGEEEA